MRAMTIAASFLLLGAGALEAQRSIDESRRAAPAGRVEVENLAGSVRVIGWDRNEVRVTGTLGPDVERLEIREDGSTIRVKVVIPDSRNRRNIDVSSRLEIRIPARSELRLRGVASDLEVSGVSGNLSLESVSGGVEVRDAAGVVAASSVSGGVEVTGSTSELRAKSVSGGVRVRGGRGRVTAETVSGSIEVDAGGAVDRGSFQSVSGGIRFVGPIARGANVSLSSHSGSVEMIVPGSVDARFELSTFSGSIRNDFGGDVRRTSEYTPGREARFTVGSGSALVSAKSFSGGVSVRRR